MIQKWTCFLSVSIFLFVFGEKVWCRMGGAATMASTVSPIITSCVNVRLKQIARSGCAFLTCDRLPIRNLRVAIHDDEDDDGVGGDDDDGVF
jgi:hypothetical protein